MDVKTLFDNIPSLLFYKDKENKFIKVNQQTAEFYGLEIEELEGTSCYDMLPEEQARKIHMDDLEVIDTARPKINILEPLTKKDGIIRWFRTNKIPLTNDKGDIIGIIGFATDVTDDMEIQKELFITKKAIAQAPSTVVITTVNGEITFVNDKFTRVTGYNYKEVIGKNPKILKSGKMTTEKYQDLWETISSGNIWRGEFINRTKVGDLYWELATVSPVLDEAGQITHYIKVAEVLSEMRASILNMWNILEYSNYYILIIDSTLTIVLCNQIFARVLGFKESLDVIGTKFSDYISKDDKYIFKSLQELLSKPNSEMSEFLSELVDKDGHKHMVKWFNSFINSDTQWTFCFGVPVKDDKFYSESVDSMRERYKDIISIHRNLIHGLKEDYNKENPKKKV